jgi:transcriptional regulator with XRE-family HTH domain
MILILDALGLGLRTVRRQHRMTLVQVSRASGLSVSFLSDIENDRTRPSLRSLQALAVCYGEPFQIIIKGNND